MNDTELFDLCKEVYKRTGWDDEAELNLGWYGNGARYIIRGRASLKSELCPLYTSDYLLEKLPMFLPARGSGRLQLTVEAFDTVQHAEGMWGDGWNACYRDWTSHYFNNHSADTPRKALLKLVIALDDAGDLK